MRVWKHGSRVNKTIRLRKRFTEKFFSKEDLCVWHHAGGKLVRK